MSLEALLGNDTITVRRETVTQDSSGGSQRTWTDRAASVPARVESLGSNQRLQYAQLVIPVTHRVFTQYADATNGDLIVTSDNLTLRVTGKETRREIGNMPTFYVYLAEEIIV